MLSWALAEEASLAGVANVLGLVGDLLSPHHGFSWLNSAGASPVPPRSEGDSSSSDREGPGSDDEETEQNGDAATASPWTLCFPSPRLEQRFRVWHNSQMFKVRPARGSPRLFLHPYDLLAGASAALSHASRLAAR